MDAESENIVQDLGLRPVADVPEKYRTVFNNFPYFNKVQSMVFDNVFGTDKPVVVSAPTGAGKTVIFELAIIRLLHKLESDHSLNISKIKIVYVAPMKAICEERFISWSKKFKGFQLNCASITGDSDNVTYADLARYNLIITTPEKWDTLTRKWRTNRSLVASIKLFLIDEIHLLHEDKRGAALEVIVCRMKTIQDSLYSSSKEASERGIRFLAVSATIPNIEDFQEWLDAADSASATQSYHFGEEYRPVKLNKVVLAYPFHQNNWFKFDMMLNYKLRNIIMQYSVGKPIIIFCNTRKSVEMTSKHLSQELTISLTPEQKAVLASASTAITDKQLKTLLVHGVGHHHAGLLYEWRSVIENLFRNGDLPLLVTTSTLAMGVNLPAHLVIIKSTKHYVNGSYQNYNEGTLMQMIGRAGRPQFDTTATAVILTTMDDKVHYEQMVNSGEVIESNLHRHLIEHLNAEISLRSISDLTIAFQWLSSTFLYIRARKLPQRYGLNSNMNDDKIINKLNEICKIEVNKLIKAEMVVMDHTVSLTSTKLGMLMAQYYVAFETMKLFATVKGTETLQEMLMIISRCHEYSDMFLRVSQKKTLNILNKCKAGETIRFPFNGKVNSLDLKINCIIQAVLGCLFIVDSSLLNEALQVMRIGERVSICLTKYLEIKKKNFSALMNSYILAKCFHARIWENSDYVSRQLRGIGTVYSGLLVAAHKTSFSLLLDSNARDIERITKKKPPFGDTVRNQVKHYPFYSLDLTKLNQSQLKLKIKLENARDLKENISIDGESLMILLVGDDEENVLLYEKYTHCYMIDKVTIEKLFTISGNWNTLRAHFISDTIAGIDCSGKFSTLPEQVSVCNIIKPAKKRTPKVAQQQNIDKYYKIAKNKQKDNLSNAVSTTQNINSELKENESPNNYKSPMEPILDDFLKVADADLLSSLEQEELFKEFSKYNIASSNVHTEKEDTDEIVETEMLDATVADDSQTPMPSINVLETIVVYPDPPEKDIIESEDHCVEVRDEGTNEIELEKYPIIYEIGQEKAHCRIRTAIPKLTKQEKYPNRTYEIEQDEEHCKMTSKISKFIEHEKYPTVNNYEFEQEEEHYGMRTEIPKSIEQEDYPRIINSEIEQEEEHSKMKIEIPKSIEQEKYHKKINFEIDQDNEHCKMRAEIPKPIAQEKYPDITNFEIEQKNKHCRIITEIPKPIGQEKQQNILRNEISKEIPQENEKMFDFGFKMFEDELDIPSNTNKAKRLTFKSSQTSRPAIHIISQNRPLSANSSAELQSSLLNKTSSSERDKRFDYSETSTDDSNKTAQSEYISQFKLQKDKCKTKKSLLRDQLINSCPPSIYLPMEADSTSTGNYSGEPQKKVAKTSESRKTISWRSPLTSQRGRTLNFRVQRRPNMNLINRNNPNSQGNHMQQNQEENSSALIRSSQPTLAAFGFMRGSSQSALQNVSSRRQHIQERPQQEFHFMTAFKKCSQNQPIQHHSQPGQYRSSTLLEELDYSAFVPKRPSPNKSPINNNWNTISLPKSPQVHPEIFLPVEDDDIFNHPEVEKIIDESNDENNSDYDLNLADVPVNIEDDQQSYNECHISSPPNLGSLQQLYGQENYEPEDTGLDSDFFELPYVQNNFAPPTPPCHCAPQRSYRNIHFPSGNYYFPGPSYNHSVPIRPMYQPTPHQYEYPPPRYLEQPGTSSAPHYFHPNPYYQDVSPYHQEAHYSVSHQLPLGSLQSRRYFLPRRGSNRSISSTAPRLENLQNFDGEEQFRRHNTKAEQLGKKELFHKFMRSLSNYDSSD